MLSILNAVPSVINSDDTSIAFKLQTTTKAGDPVTAQLVTRLTESVRVGWQLIQASHMEFKH